MVLKELITTVVCVCAEGGSRADFHEAGTHRQGIVRRGVQGHRQSDAADCGHQDHRPGGGRGRDRGHPAGDYGPLAVRQSLRHPILWLLPQSN